MSQKHKSRTSALRLTTLFSLFLFSTIAWSDNLKDQNTIIETYLTTSSENKAMARRIEKDAQEIAPQRLGTLVKAWCSAATIAPTPHNLLKCAKVNSKIVSEYINPHPSREAAQLAKNKQSLAMIRAALEIAGGQANISPKFRDSLRQHAACFRGLAAGLHDNHGCD